jgi:hypothetical protein
LLGEPQGKPLQGGRVSRIGTPLAHFSINNKRSLHELPITWEAANINQDIVALSLSRPHVIAPCDRAA